MMARSIDDGCTAAAMGSRLPRQRGSHREEASILVSFAGRGGSLEQRQQRNENQRSTVRCGRQGMRCCWLFVYPAALQDHAARLDNRRPKISITHVQRSSCSVAAAPHWHYLAALLMMAPDRWAVGGRRRGARAGQAGRRRGRWKMDDGQMIRLPPVYFWECVG